MFSEALQVQPSLAFLTPGLMGASVDLPSMQASVCLTGGGKYWDGRPEFSASESIGQRWPNGSGPGLKEGLQCGCHCRVQIEVSETHPQKGS
jgi:hypothetical protein